MLRGFVLFFVSLVFLAPSIVLAEDPALPMTPVGVVKPVEAPKSPVEAVKPVVEAPKSPSKVKVVPAESKVPAKAEVKATPPVPAKAPVEVKAMPPAPAKRPVLSKSSAVVSGDMVSVPAGEFTMGSTKEEDEGPVRRVYLDAFQIDKTEVTVGAYRKCLDAGACSKPKRTFLKSKDFNWGAEGRELHPINGVNWKQMETYCKWAGKRLPTEAEWEKAARGADGNKYPWGGERADCRRAVMKNKKKGKGCGEETTAEVGSKPGGASPYGALDMAGNVAEWTADGYGPYDASAARNPKGAADTKRRVIRGGSFGIFSYNLRGSIRYHNSATYRTSGIGGRCAK